MPDVRENQVAYWKKQLTLADERFKDFLKDAKEVTKLYEAQKEAKNAFNILYANTETLLPALFNAMPRPIAQRRFKDADPVAKAVCDTITRSLEYYIDCPDAEYDPFFNIMRDAVLGALVPGLGVTWFRYDYETQRVPGQPPPPGVGQEDQGKAAMEVAKEIEKEGSDAESGDLTEDGKRHEEEVSYEAVCSQNVPYHMVRWGFARSWANVPWVGRLHVMTKADVRKQFGGAIAEEIEYGEPKSDSDAGEAPEGDANEEENQGSGKVTDVWEIWHKSSGSVLFIAPAYADGPLKVVPDPLGLTGFFPCPEPLQFTAKVSSLIPTPPYKYYEQQAGELNNITVRIKRVIAAIKVRGFYNGQLKDDLGKLLESDDNTLIPAPIAALFEGKDLANQIWLMPLRELAETLQQLIMQRQQIKQTIYEITGISDIIRGSTVASETATAQNLKSQWGTLRLKRSQKMVQDYVRGCMRIMTEIIGNKFSPQTLAQVTNLPYMQPEQKQQIKQLLPQVAQAAQAEAMQQQPQAGQAPAGVGAPGGAAMPAGPAPPSGPPGQSPGSGSPQPGPAAQQMQQLQMQMQQIDWGQVMQMMRSNVLRGFKIDIETNSTIDADATEDRKNISEFLTGIGQSMQAFAPMMEMGAMSQPMFKAIMTAIARRFEFGAEVEDEIAAMPDQLPQKPDPAMQKAQVEMQQSQQEGQMKLQGMQLQSQTEQAKVQMEAQSLQHKREYEAAKHTMMMQKLAREEEIAQAEHQRKMIEMQMQATMPPLPPQASRPKKGNGRAAV